MTVHGWAGPEAAARVLIEGYRPPSRGTRSFSSPFILSVVHLLLAVTNLLMAGFLIAWAAVEVARELAGGLDLSVPPFVAGGLGLLGLTALLLSSDSLLRARRPRSRPVQDDE